MSSTRRDDAALLDIAGAARSIASYIASQTKDDFLHNDQLRSAVLFQLLVIGEAVKRLSESFRSAHDDVSWRRIAGMRDRLIHGYDDIDVHEVWRVACTDVPDLLVRLGSVIPTRTSE